MDYRTTYKMASGYIDDIEDDINRLSELGYIIIGNMTTNVIQDSLFYSQLMYKLEITNDETK